MSDAEDREAFQFGSHSVSQVDPMVLRSSMILAAGDRALWEEAEEAEAAVGTEEGEGREELPLEASEPAPSASKGRTNRNARKNQAENQFGFQWIPPFRYKGRNGLRYLVMRLSPLLFLTFFSFWYTIKRIIWNISLQITCIPAEREFPVFKRKYEEGVHI